MPTGRATQKALKFATPILKGYNPLSIRRWRGGRGMLFKVSKNKALEGLVGAVNANNRMCLGILVLGA